MASFNSLTFRPAVFVPQKPTIRHEHLVVENLILSSGQGIGGALGPTTLNLSTPPAGFTNASNICSYVNYLGQNFYDVALSFAIQIPDSPMPGRSAVFYITNLPGVVNPWGANLPVVNISTNMPCESIIDITSSNNDMIPILALFTDSLQFDTNYLVRVRIFYQAQ